MTRRTAVLALLAALTAATLVAVALVLASGGRASSSAAAAEAARRDAPRAARLADAGGAPPDATPPVEAPASPGRTATEPLTGDDADLAAPAPAACGSSAPCGARGTARRCPAWSSR